MKKTALLMLVLLSASLSACSTHRPVDTTNLRQLRDITRANLPQDQNFAINNIRIKALKETALSLGAQAGLAARAQEIDRSLSTQVASLDNIYNFNALMLANSVLPPVLVQSDQSVSIDGTDTLRISDQTYKIQQQAKFVTAAPSWRDYLWMSYDKPAPPNALLLPQTSAERSAWKKYITEGWNQGVTQANAIFEENTEKLKRDYDGMLLYKELLAKDMITQPYVAKTDLGITGNGSQMQINDRVLRISAKPQLETNSHLWKPVIIPGQ